LTFVSQLIASLKEGGMIATPERTTPVTVRLRRLAAVPFVLCLLVFSAADHAASQAITIDKTGFEASAREFPACKIEAMDGPS
jgi:hypothetical protein